MNPWPWPTSTKLRPARPLINDRIDEAYAAKYKGSSYLKPMISTGSLRDRQGHAAPDKSINLRR
jgi:hypothetical protein